jgi:hypothetical protein
VDNVVSASTLAPPKSSPQPPRRRPGTGALLALVNGVMAGVGGVYIRTHSVMITVIAAVAAIALVAMMLVCPR